MKDYKEIAKKIFERRDKYLAKQKKKKKLIRNITIPVFCFCFLLAISLSLWQSGILVNDITVIEKQQNGFFEEWPNFSDDEKIPSDSTPSDNAPSVSGEKEEPNSNPEPTVPSDSTPDNPPSNNGTERIIDSIDKMNFYSAKKIIKENSFLPMRAKKNSGISNLSDPVVAYDKEFTITKITYFNIRINKADSFLAERLGGTGLAEVVVVETNIPNVYKMITFKLNDKYYTCLMNEVGAMSHNVSMSDEFTTNRYTSGFDILQNNEQENYRFAVHYEGSQVIGFESSPINATAVNEVGEEITFIDDYCVVIFTEQNITINQLEDYLKNLSEGDAL